MATVAASSWRDNVNPAELVRLVLRLPELAFAREYGEAPFLAIRLADDSGTIAAGLEATFSGAETRAAQPIGAMRFDTQTEARLDLAAIAADARRRADNAAEALARAFAEAPHYVVPLKKRQDVDAAFADRISVGRAPNKDIVLRHGSISKFHAWFQFDEAAAIFVVDAGSKNGTRVNGAMATAREPMRVDSGDRVTFGSVEARVCVARALWRALHQGI